MREKAQEWLCREVRAARMAQGRAENRPGVTKEELERLENKVAVLDWLLEMIGRVGGGWISEKGNLSVDDLKRALVKVKEFCEKIDRCDNCPLYDMEACYCPMNHHNPCNWHIDDWKEDTNESQAD